MEAFIILCDYAEQVNGKLNIIGGGFSRISPIKPTFDFSVAGKIYIPWNETNQKKHFKLMLVNADGQGVTQEPNQVPVVVDTHIEAGRPPGLAQGTKLDFPFAFRFTNLDLHKGRYTWILEVDGQNTCDVTFDVFK